uniref:Secreted protein n=1 Tax=Mesocestoides corti TaxID=53468 RepID=A0A5K3F4F3_MESCO
AVGPLNQPRPQPCPALSVQASLRGPRQVLNRRQALLFHLFPFLKIRIRLIILAPTTGLAQAGYRSTRSVCSRTRFNRLSPFTPSSSSSSSSSLSHIHSRSRAERVQPSAHAHAHYLTHQLKQTSRRATRQSLFYLLLIPLLCEERMCYSLPTRACVYNCVYFLLPRPPPPHLACVLELFFSNFSSTPYIVSPHHLHTRRKG